MPTAIDQPTDLMPNLLRGIGKDTLMYLPAQLVPALIGIISMPIYTSFFAPAKYGLYFVVIATVEFFRALLSGWLGQSALRFFDGFSRQEKENEFFTTLFFGWLIIVCLGIGVGEVALFLLKNVLGMELFSLLQIGLWVFASTLTSSILFILLRAKRQSAAYAVFRVTTSVARLGLVVILVLVMNMDVESLLWGVLVIDICSIVIMTTKLRVLSYVSFKKFSCSIMMQFLNYGLPLTGSALSFWILSLSDRYIIQGFRGAKEVGLYSISYNAASKSLNLVVVVLMLAAFPVILNSWNSHGKETTERLISSLIRYYFLIVTPMLIGVTVLAKPIITVLASPEYLQGYKILPWVAFGMFLFGLSQYTNKVWELMQKTKVLLGLMAGAAVMNLFLNFIFVPEFGYVAAGVTTAASYAFYLLLSLYLCKGKLSFRPDYVALSRICGASTVMGLALTLFKSLVPVSFLSLLVLIFIGVILYLLVLLLTGEISAEISILRAVFLGKQT